jgi:hypothetical protein
MTKNKIYIGIASSDQKTMVKNGSTWPIIIVSNMEVNHAPVILKRFRASPHNPASLYHLQAQQNKFQT